MAQVTSTGGVTAPATSPAPAASAKKADTPAGAGTTPAFKDDLAKATEKLQPVHHHGRAKIVAGEREGQYLNTSGNARDGQAFTMEYHGGRRWHVYGTGADRVVIAFAKPSDDKPAVPAARVDGGAPAEPARRDRRPARLPDEQAFTTPATGGAVALD